MITQTCKNPECDQVNPQPMRNYSKCPSGMERRECRSCLTKKNKINYIKNKERIKAVAKIHRKENKEKLQDYGKKYYRKNKTKILEYSSVYQKNNKDSVNLSSKKYRDSNPEVIKDRTLQKKYKINGADYEQMMKHQNEKCAICKVHNNDLKVALCVDHCHSTGKIRGLLCGSCNRALGLFRDSITFLSSAIDYLNKEDDL
ncbi:MAG: endonuclease VII domain-containing protein [Bacteroidales bacterium]